MDAEAFLAELDAEVGAALARIGEKSAQGEPGPDITVESLLRIALKNEIEASEEAARWMTSERDVRVKLSLARQCGDEAKHYRLIEDRLRALGVDTTAIDPLAQGFSPMFEYLQSLTSTVERIAAGQFTREALAKVRNEVFIEYCELQGDHETATLYRDVIAPDEHHHHELGRRLLARLAADESSQEKARAAARRTLELAEELQDAMRIKRGIARAPGC
jgi:uncharacterized ferritin-like protein (DUF455 family)